MSRAGNYKVRQAQALFSACELTCGEDRDWYLFTQQQLSMLCAVTQCELCAP